MGFKGCVVHIALGFKINKNFERWHHYCLLLFSLLGVVSALNIIQFC